MLDGRCGEAVRVSMEALTKLGDAVGAQKMVEISSAHLIIGGLNVLARELPLGDTCVIEKLAEMGAKVRVPTTSQVGASPELLRKYGFQQSQIEQHEKIRGHFARMGVTQSDTCDPWLHGNLPRFGEHVSWNEPACSVYANSVIGARSNREPRSMCLLAAMAGRVPEYALHIDENRRGQVLFRISKDKLDDSDYPKIAEIVRSIATHEKIPVITGIPKNVQTRRLVEFGAYVSRFTIAGDGDIDGGVLMFHIPGVTPEARTEEEAFAGERPNETIEIGVEDLKNVTEKVFPSPEGKVDLVLMGCTQYSIEELKKLADLLKNRKVRKGTKLVISTTQYFLGLASELGLLKTLEKAGATVVTVCPLTMVPLVPKITPWVRTIMLPYGKFGQYIPAVDRSLNVRYGSEDQCVRAVTDEI
jgi:predicted aconitase